MVDPGYTLICWWLLRGLTFLLGLMKMATIYCAYSGNQTHISCILGLCVNHYTTDVTTLIMAISLCGLVPERSVLTTTLARLAM